MTCFQVRVVRVVRVPVQTPLCSLPTLEIGPANFSFPPMLHRPGRMLISCRWVLAHPPSLGSPSSEARRVVHALLAKNLAAQSQIEEWLSIYTPAGRRVPSEDRSPGKPQKL
jgi:hypothetical protein